MATDDSQPNLKLIIGIGVLSLGLLVGVRFAIKSYFLVMMEREHQVKVASRPLPALEALSAKEQKALEPLERSMAAMAEKGRAGLGEALLPQPSDDRAPLLGWSARPASDGGTR